MEGKRSENDKMVPIRGRLKKASLKEGGNGWKVSYTNINGLMSALTELNDYLRERKPDILGLVETKLSDSVEIENCAVHATSPRTSHQK